MAALLILGVALAHINVSWGDNGNTTASAQTQDQATTCPGDKPVADPRPSQGTPVQVEAGCNVKGDVEVAGSQNGTYAPAHLSEASSGNILSCPEGCWIRADFGANITPRTVPDLANEMKTSGCEGNNGCATVTCWEMKGGTLTKLASCPTSSDTGKAAPPTSTPDTGKAAPPTSAPNAAVDCDPSIPKGKAMLIPANCVVEGDVAVGMSETGPWTKLYDSNQTTGLVVVTQADVWVKAPYGASASGVSPQDAFEDVFDLGCGLDRGCYGGVDTVTVNVTGGNIVVTHGGLKTK
jgi:hypothetical protein